MKINPVHGPYLESGDAPSPWHRRITRVEPIPNTRVGNYISLECGHKVQGFGKPDGIRALLCTQCRDEAAK